jgi:hypothetical protein
MRLIGYKKTIPGNEKLFVDTIDFAVNHPETYVE